MLSLKHPTDNNYVETTNYERLCVKDGTVDWRQSMGGPIFSRFVDPLLRRRAPVGGCRSLLIVLFVFRLPVLLTVYPVWLAGQVRALTCVDQWWR